MLRELRHALLDRREILGRERALVREVVVEAVLDHRADRDLRVGKQLLHRVREQVRRRMADDVETFGVLVGDDRDVGVVVDRDSDVSTSLPSTLPASAALARPGPIDAATSRDRDRVVEERTEPSGNLTFTIEIYAAPSSYARDTLSACFALQQLRHK